MSFNLSGKEIFVFDFHYRITGNDKVRTLQVAGTDIRVAMDRFFNSEEVKGIDVTIIAIERKG